ncbi:hypothetical protein BD413DRAFT_74385 [Trametes elegans]|nr:hypothetical protein BD413DRAFT_74385 [Trametes elegans]
MTTGRRPLALQRSRWSRPPRGTRPSLARSSSSSSSCPCRRRARRGCSGASACTRSTGRCRTAGTGCGMAWAARGRACRTGCGSRGSARRCTGWAVARRARSVSTVPSYSMLSVADEGWVMYRRSGTRAEEGGEGAGAAGGHVAAVLVVLPDLVRTGRGLSECAVNCSAGLAPDLRPFECRCGRIVDRVNCRFPGSEIGWTSVGCDLRDRPDSAGV